MNSYKTHFRFKSHTQTESEGIEKYSMQTKTQSCHFAACFCDPENLMIPVGISISVKSMEQVLVSLLSVPVHLHLPSQLQLPSMLPPLRTLSCLALSWGGETPDQSPV